VGACFHCCKCWFVFAMVPAAALAHRHIAQPCRTHVRTVNDSLSQQSWTIAHLRQPASRFYLQKCLTLLASHHHPPFPLSRGVGNPPLLPRR
jgi:hypothetical protein